jgi:hypothetical protein
MGNSPIPVYRDEISTVYATNRCAERLQGCEPEVLECTLCDPNDAALPGVVRHRVLRRTSQDGGCTVMTDEYMRADGAIEEIIFCMEIDGIEYYSIKP